MKPAALKVQEALVALGIARTLIELPVSARTAREAADAVGVSVGQIAKSLIFRHPLIYAAGGVPECVFPLSPDELLQATGGQVADIKHAR